MESAHDLTVRLRDLLHWEHGALADFLLVLATFDERRLWAELEYGSLFDFLHRELRLSKSAAFYRKTAVALVREFPAVADALRSGKLCLMTVAEVARVLTPENARDLLPRFFDLSKREAKVLVASLVPAEAPSMRVLVTPVRVAPAVQALALSAPEPRGNVAVLPVEPEDLVLPVELEPSLAAAPVAQPRPATPVAAPRPEDAVEPLSGKLSRVHLTVENAFLEDYEAARAALSHSHPKAGMAEILQLGLKALAERHAKRKGLVKRPRKTPPPAPADPRDVPAHVSREVWKRDGGKCQWRLPSGEICGSTYRVEIDHITPRAAGGPSTVENCRLACKPHNDLAARRFFGDAWMDRYTGRKRLARQQRGSATSEPRIGVAGQSATDPCGSHGRRPAAPPA